MSTNPFDFLGLDDHEDDVINPRIKAQLGDLLRELDLSAKPTPKPTPQPPKKDEE